MTTIVIGSGPNGLAAAFYLARAGLKPVVLERRARIGGGAIDGELHPGFRCPTLTHEVLLHQRVFDDMDLRRHGVELLSSDVDVFAPSLDGPAFALYRDAERSAAALRAVHRKDADVWPRFQATMTRAAEALAPVFASAPPDLDHPSAGDLWRLLGAGRRFRALGQRDAHRLLRWVPMPVADLVSEWFEHERLRAVMAGPGVSGTMLGPRSAGSGLVLLMRQVHASLAGGRPRRIRGGPGRLTDAMADAARAAGADIRTGVPVERILTSNGRVAGVLAGGREIASGVVVSSADPRTTCLNLLDPQDLAPDVATKIRNYRAAGTLAKVNLALAGLPAFAGAGAGADATLLSSRIHVGPTLDYLERAFDHVKYGELSVEPWLDVTIPSILDPQLAPAGAHVASIYVHYAPRRLRNAEWADERATLLRCVMAVLERYAPGIASLVLATEVITPEDLEHEYGLTGGHIFHGELSPDQLFVMRPLVGFARYESPIRGLYLCGAGTHPGGFLTGASGRLAAARVLRAEGHGRS